MSSTDLEAPSRRLTLTAILIVVGLHVLTAIALAAVKTPEIKIDKKETPPIEIELISLPPEPVVPEVEVIEEVVPKEEPKPQVAEPQPPKPKAKPVVQPKPEAPAKPVVTEKKITPKAAPIAPVKEPKVIEKPKVDTSVADEQHKIIMTQAEKAAQNIADAKKAQDIADAKKAQDIADAKKAQDIADAKKAQDIADAKKAQDIADAKKAQTTAAASNTPQNFTATNADWASKPNFSFPDRAARSARSGETFTVVLVLRVNKQGRIDSVSVAKPSGNTAVDKEAQRQVRSGKFKPFTNKDGVPVVGNVTLPVAYKVP